jgi:hypothetical protein
VEEYFDATAPGGLASTIASRLVEIDYWLLLLLSAFPLIAYFYLTRGRRRGENRAHKGLCVTCGYDLRAHAPGSCCPECGMPIRTGISPSGKSSAPLGRTE